MFELNFLNSQPPIFTAFAAVIIVLFWQIPGFFLLELFLRRFNFGKESRYLVFLWCWLLVPVLGGAYQIGLELLPANLNFYSLKFIPSVGLFIYGFYLFFTNRIKILAIPILPLLRSLTFMDKIFCSVSILVFFIHSLSAAHPQWLYDQLAYHLVVPNLLVQGLHPDALIIDSHLALTGPFEWCCANLGLIFKNPHLLIGASQFYAWILHVVGISFLLRMFAKNSPLNLTTMCLLLFSSVVLLTCFLEPDLKYLVKPDFLIAIMMAWCLMALSTVEYENTKGLLVTMAFAAMSLKSTALLPAGIILCILTAKIFRTKCLRKEWNFIWVGIGVLALICLYRLRLGASPFFPVDRKIIASSFATPNATMYWTSIGGEQNNAWLLGLILICEHLLTSPLYIGFFTLGFLPWYDRLRLKDKVLNQKVFYFVGFALVFFLIGTLFVNATSSFRFFASGYLVLALFPVGYFFESNVFLRFPWSAFIILMGVFAVSSQTDVALIRMMRFNLVTSSQSMTQQVAMFEPSEFLNKLHITGIVPSNDQTKYYLKAAVLTHTLSPREIWYWNDIEQNLKVNLIPDYINAIIEIPGQTLSDCEIQNCRQHAHFGMREVYPRLVALAESKFQVIGNDRYKIYLRKSGPSH